MFSKASRRAKPSITPSATSVVPAPSIPTVCVVVPCYSGELYFSETVQSILAQTHPKIEIIFHDNGSSPSYAALIQRTANSVGAKVYRSDVNRYGEGLRYDVLPHLTADYTAILHDDDVFEVDKISDDLRYMVSNDLDYLMTDRRYIDAEGRLLETNYEEVNRHPVEVSDFPYQFIADTYYRGLRLHFSTMMMKTKHIRKNLIGDPFLPRITDSYFMHQLLLDRSLKGVVLARKSTRVRVHGANDMLYTKFDDEARGREIALLQFGEYSCFQDMVQRADNDQLARIFAIFPGVPLVEGESRVGMLVRAALDLRNWTGCKPLMGAWCIHQAFALDPTRTMELVREHSPFIGGGPATDTNSLMRGLYDKYVRGVGDLLQRPVPPPPPPILPAWDMTELHQHRQALAEIRASTSWKITAPLRTLAARFKRA